MIGPVRVITEPLEQATMLQKVRFVSICFAAVWMTVVNRKGHDRRDGAFKGESAHWSQNG